MRPKHDPRPEDLKLAALLRLIRKRDDKTQKELARMANVPLRDLMKIENGRVADVPFGRTRSLLDAAGGRAKIWTYYNGESADRLVDERHAALVETACRICQLVGWRTLLELSFSEYGERGSVDLLAAHELHRAIAVCEVKSVFGSLEDMNRTLDAKVRLAPTLVRERLHWQPQHVARILIVPRDTTIRRQVNRFAATMGSIYPGRTDDVHNWLRKPTSDLSAIWYVDDRGVLAR